MNEQGIIAYGGLDPARIDPADFTNTLAMEALRVGLWTEGDIDRLRAELMNALAEIIGLYTKNESSSIKANEARDLTASMLYNIDAYLLSLGDIGQALTALHERKPYELYGKGYLINKKHFEMAKHLYASARYSRLKNASESYNKTLDKYFHYYLTHYDPRFNAHEKIYLSLTEYGLGGAFSIKDAISVLKQIININNGRTSDVTLTDAAEAVHPAEAE